MDKKRGRSKAKSTRKSLIAQLFLVRPRAHSLPHTHGLLIQKRSSNLVSRTNFSPRAPTHPTAMLSLEILAIPLLDPHGTLALIRNPWSIPTRPTAQAIMPRVLRITARQITSIWTSFVRSRTCRNLPCPSNESRLPRLPVWWILLLTLPHLPPLTPPWYRRTRQATLLDILSNLFPRTVLSGPKPPLTRLRYGL